MEVLMHELKWEMLSEGQGRLEVECIKNYMESRGSRWNLRKHRVEKSEDGNLQYFHNINRYTGLHSQKE